MAAVAIVFVRHRHRTTQQSTIPINEEDDGLSNEVNEQAQQRLCEFSDGTALALAPVTSLRGRGARLESTVGLMRFMKMHQSSF